MCRQMTRPRFLPFSTALNAIAGYRQRIHDTAIRAGVNDIMDPMTKERAEKHPASVLIASDRAK
ncbi:hypothetical protein PIIN_04381 [Serendipita indica DSM 11827]|uniref:Uncharacterized protein n=1 Tax=Serendipita indica (strain DSM 11827) TaxID=1109443 RepID=G4TGK0_SERID|nr:hypothetical protein PIIN_04381 [Serendipita indica DSM 11827]